LVRFLMSLRLRQPDIIQQLRTEVPEHLVDNQKIGLKIARMKCWLYPFATAKHDLLLADHPCIFTVGIDNPDLVIAPPIGPRKAFMAAGSERLANILRQQRPKHLLTC
jgi:hypothetical protein